MNDDNFMSLFSTSMNNNHQAQTQAFQDPLPMDHPLLWGDTYGGNDGHYISPPTGFDPPVGMPATTASNERDTQSMLRAILETLESLGTKVQSLHEKQVNMEEKLDHLIEDMYGFSREAIYGLDEIHVTIDGRRLNWRQLDEQDVNSQSGDESEGGSRSGRASV